MKRAIYPGTFDPITNGHIDILKKASHVFDEVILAVADVTGKNTLFTTEERERICVEATKDIPSVKVMKYDGLSVEFADSLGAITIVRGLRAVSDFEYELQLALMNKKLHQEIDTMFFVPESKYLYLSSSMIRSVMELGGKLSDLIPANVEKNIIGEVQKMIKYILFDLDGTIFDYKKAELVSFRKTMESVGFLGDFEEIHSAYNRINHHYWKAFERHEISSEDLRIARFRDLGIMYELNYNPEEIGDRYTSFLSESGYIIEGSFDMLDSLKGKFKFGVITNGLKDVQIPRIKISGLEKYFDWNYITISQEVGVPKPDPKIFEICMNKFGNPPKEEVIILGDNLVSDIEGGNKFGIKTCWYNQFNKELKAGDSTPDFEIKDLSEFSELLNKI